MFGLIQIQFLF